MTEVTGLRADARRNRERVIAAARALFVERGFDVPLEDVARRADVGIATLYRRFPDRPSLLVAVVLDNLEIVRAELESVSEEGLDAWSGLLRVMRTFVLDLRAGVMLPVVVDAVRGAEADESLEHAVRIATQRREDVLERVTDLVERAQREGSLRADVAAGDVLLGFVQLSRPLPVGSREFNREMALRHFGLFADGLRAAPEGAAGTTELAGEPITGEDVELHVRLRLGG
jgi:AcrR family transcriptional regulator